MDVKFPSIPAVSMVMPKEIASILRPMREILLQFAGSGTGRVVSVQELIAVGLIDGEAVGGGLAPQPLTDYTPPAAPTGLEAAGALANVILKWDAHSSDNIAVTEVWRAETNDISLAERIGTAPGQTYVDAIGSGAIRYYWVRYISRANVAGPFNAQLGLQGQTAYDAGYLMDVLAANPPPGATYNPLLYVQATPIVIDGITIPAGVYMTAAFVRALSVGNAQIANAAIDNAKVASLSADKITAGDIAAARIQANIVSALVGKYNTLSALVASIGQLQIDAGGYLRTEGVTAYTAGTGFWLGQVGGAYKLRIGNPSGSQMKWDGTDITITGAIMGGAYTGYAWPTAGAGGGFYLGPSGLLLGSSNDGKYLQVTSTGDIYAPQFSIIAGVATFSGALSAASGTYAGALSAASGTFAGTLTAGAVNAVNTINLAGQAVTIPVSAYTAGGVNGVDGDVLLQSATITSTGAPITILVSAGVQLGTSDQGSVRALLRLYRGATLLYSEPVAGGIVTLSISDTPGAGAHTYHAKLNQNTAGYTNLIQSITTNRSLCILETKK